MKEWIERYPHWISKFSSQSALYTLICFCGIRGLCSSIEFRAISVVWMCEFSFHSQQSLNSSYDNLFCFDMNWTNVLYSNLLIRCIYLLTSSDFRCYRKRTIKICDVTANFVELKRPSLSSPISKFSFKWASQNFNMLIQGWYDLLQFFRPMIGN